MEIDQTPSLTSLEDFRTSEMDNCERMSGLTGRTVAFNGGDERLEWAEYAAKIELNYIGIANIVAVFV